MQKTKTTLFTRSQKHKKYKEQYRYKNLLRTQITKKKNNGQLGNTSIFITRGVCNDRKSNFYSWEFETNFLRLSQHFIFAHKNINSNIKRITSI